MEPMEDNALNPESSPRVAVGVRRLNHIPLYIVLAGIVIFCGVVIMVAFKRNAEQPVSTQSEHGGSTDSYAQNIAGTRTGFINATHSTVAPVQTFAPRPSPTPATDSTEMEIRKKAFYAALYAQSAVQDPLVDKQLAQQSQQPQSKYQFSDEDAAKAEKADRNNLGGYTAEDLNALSPNLTEPSPAPQQNPNSLAAFAGRKDRWTLNNRVERPPSPFVLQTGWVIPALLISGMESELQGSIIAQVSQDVYDSPSGQHLLIPQGARLFGEYSNAIAYGQARIFVAWKRIIFPNGNTLDISEMPGSDSQGQAGFHDTVDNHFLRTFGSALLMSAISGLTALSQPQSNFQNGPNLQGSLSSALGQQLGAATSSLLEKNLSIPPTLKVRAGYSFNVVVVKDLIFPGEYHVPNYSVTR